MKERNISSQTILEEGPSQVIEPALWSVTQTRRGDLEMLMSRESSCDPACKGEHFLSSQVLSSIN